jgi:hypothetical protein
MQMSSPGILPLSRFASFRLRDARCNVSFRVGKFDEAGSNGRIGGIAILSHRQRMTTVQAQCAPWQWDERPIDRRRVGR